MRKMFHTAVLAAVCCGVVAVGAVGTASATTMPGKSSGGTVHVLSCSDGSSGFVDPNGCIGGTPGAK